MFTFAAITIMTLIFSIKIDKTEQRPKVDEKENILPQGNNSGHTDPAVSQLYQADSSGQIDAELSNVEEEQTDMENSKKKRGGWWFFSWSNDESKEAEAEMHTSDAEDTEAGQNQNKIPDGEHPDLSYDTQHHSGEDQVIANTETEKELYSQLMKSTHERRPTRHGRRRVGYRSMKRKDTVLNEYPDVILPGNPDKVHVLYPSLSQHIIKLTIKECSHFCSRKGALCL